MLCVVADIFCVGTGKGKIFRGQTEAAPDLEGSVLMAWTAVAVPDCSADSCAPAHQGLKVDPADEALLQLA